MIRHLTSPKYAGVLEYGTGFGDAYLLRRSLFMPWELPDLLGPDVVREGWEALDLRHRLAVTVPALASARAKVSALELSWYMNGQLLRDADWAGMAHSLEIRVPFVDVPLFRALAPAMLSANPPSKRHLAAVCGPTMPEAVRARRKTGFTVPVRDWLGVGDSVNPRDGTPERGAPDRGMRGWARYIHAHAVA
jgi:asparagine synthase (glutamine-hydrolysing)